MTFFDEEGNIRSDLLDKEARESAEAFVPMFKDKWGNQKPSRDAIKNSQLRRFFGEFKSLKNKLDQQGEPEKNFGAIKPLVKMAKAKVAYAKARKVVPQAFADWLQSNVDNIEDDKDFKAFLLHFEAIIGFCYALNPKD